MLHVTHIKRRKYFILLDIILVVISAAITILVRRSFDLPFFVGRLDYAEFSLSNFAAPALLLGMIYAATLYVLGVYDSWATPSILEWFQRLLVPNFVIVGSAFTALYVNQSFSFPRSLLITLFMVNLSLSLWWRLWYFRQMAREKSEIAVVGSSSDAIRFLNECELTPFKGRVLVKALFLTNSQIVSGIPLNVPVRALSELESFAENNPLVAIIVVPSEQDQQNVFSQVFQAARRGTGVYALPSAYEILFGRLKYFTFNDLPLLELKLDPPSDLYAIMKRGGDIVLASFVLLATLPVLLSTAIVIKLTSKGSIFYTQTRVGLGGKPFKIFKFRSMISDAEASTGPVLSSKNDPRITTIGKFLRQTRIDELPQLINILKGEMSFVGPRPERPEFVKQFEQELPWYKERNRVRPGVTGLAQVRGHYSSSVETKLKYDLAYLSNQSLSLDFRILARTVKTILTKAGV
jgi:exopolysaccharide biosynthesis polyprenyl glycosylphosphotransferase